MAMGETGAARPAGALIEIWPAVKAGLVAVFADFNTFFAGAWIWVVAIYASSVAGGYVSAALGHPEEGGRAGAVVGFVAYLIGGTAFAVGWHRHVLFGEAVTNTSTLQFGRRERRFLLFSLPIGVITIAVSYLLGLAVAYFAGVYSDAIPPTPAWAGIGALAPAVLLFAIEVRLSFFAPLAAADVPGNLLRRAWRLSAGNGWRILGGIFLIVLIFLIPRLAENFGFTMAMSRNGGVFVFSVFSLIGNLINFAFIAIMAGFMSHAAAQIVGRTLPLNAADAKALDLEPAPRP